MTFYPSRLLIPLMAIILWTSCQPAVREEDKVFHGGPVNSGFGVQYFGLYKGDKYQFCDGDFMDHGCYTGNFILSGDTITFLKLKKHAGIPTNRFLIRRYRDMDSSYWQWKYPEEAYWQGMRKSDSLRGASGDIFPLDEKGKVVFDKNNYFIIRLDSLAYSR